MFEESSRTSRQTEARVGMPASAGHDGEDDTVQTPSPTISTDRIMERLEVLGVLEDLEMAQELIDVFIYDAGQSLEELGRAVGTGDVKACERLAHRVKGSSLNLGVDELGALARSMEEKGRSGDMAGATEVYESMRRTYNDLCVVARGILRKAA
jgi:HPt (histidine-containing phosphotransfer) domain-containing protein